MENPRPTGDNIWLLVAGDVGELTEDTERPLSTLRATSPRSSGRRRATMSWGRPARPGAAPGVLIDHAPLVRHPPPEPVAP
ncbi:hypothetical protein ABZ820_32410 [Streptomyces diacarni]|uniref:hypothetical protein n=1 Tax=Streptomyces diacarni TaxID=2800381 RepID=UPI003404527D